jgi:pyruvate,water dikinase
VSWFRRNKQAKAKSPKEQSAPKSDLRVIRDKFEHFYALLEANNQALQLISDMEEKSQGDYLFDLNYIRHTLRELRLCVNEIIDRMVALGGEDYESLRKRFELIDAEIDVVLPGNRPLQKDEYTRPFEQLSRMHQRSVGGKNAQLGEMKKLGLPVPEGFAITAWAYKHFIDANDLQEKISSAIAAIDFTSLDDLQRASREIGDLVRHSEVPADQVEAIEDAARRLTEKTGIERFSIRSSAVGEDTLFSFAGQYASYLNVRCDELIQYYCEVLASKFTPKAIYYFLSHDISESELAMSVGCVTMINAKAAGVAYTRCPVDPADDRVAINAVWGLGKYLVAGTVNPDMFRVRRDDLGLENVEISHKPVRLALDPKGGVTEEMVPEEDRDRPCVAEEQLVLLAKYAVELEKHYGSPQDIEWVVDENDRLCLLQTRPLQVMAARPDAPIPEIDKAKVMIKGGITVCHGAGSGPVYHVSSGSDLPNVPEGAVLAAPHPFPGLITVMDRISALVTYVGSMASHMATIAREYRTPCVVGVPDILGLPEGRTVTVDATGATVYDGDIPELIKARQPEYSGEEHGSIYDVLGRVLDLISPLRLLFPDDDDFKAENCVTFHDITRFAHQKASEEMFLGATDIEDKDRLSLKLKTDIPLTVNIIYIDREYDPDAEGGWVDQDNIESEPMQQFWDGVREEGWPKTSAASTMKPVGPIAGKEGHIRTKLDFSENSFAIISHEYMIVSLRMGYHLATVEAMCSDDLSKNYLSMQFSYGGSTLDRRTRRVELLTDIMRAMGFHCQRKADYLGAYMSYKDRRTIADRLHKLGRLTLMTKQLDMALSSEGVTKWYTREFMKKLGLNQDPQPKTTEQKDTQ